MFPPSFDYHRPESLTDALEELAASDPAETAVLAGGHSLIPDMKAGDASPSVVIDVGGLDDLRGIEVGADAISVGALTTYATVADSDPLRDGASVLAEAASHVGDVQIRNRGTIGGNLVASATGADLPAAAVAADATVVIRSRTGERDVPADAFFRDGGDTDVGPGELVTSIRVPAAPAAGGAYRKKTHPASGYALVGVAAVVGLAGSDAETESDPGDESGSESAPVVSDVRVAANGVLDGPARLHSVEDALVGTDGGDSAVSAAAERAPEDLDRSRLVSDVEASGEFRAHLLTVYVERALADAVERAVP